MQVWLTGFFQSNIRSNLKENVDKRFYKWKVKNERTRPCKKRTFSGILVLILFLPLGRFPFILPSSTVRSIFSCLRIWPIQFLFLFLISDNKLFFSFTRLRTSALVFLCFHFTSDGSWWNWPGRLRNFISGWTYGIVALAIFII